MKGFFLERICHSPVIKCSGWSKDGLYVVYEDSIEFLDTGRIIRTNMLIEWVVCSEDAMYAIVETGLFLIKNMNISDKISIDLKNIGLKEAWHVNSKIFIQTESEVIVYSTKTHKMLRYAPYGHQIVDVSIDFLHGNEFVLLLTSHGQRVIRTIKAAEELEETGQISVSKDAYKVLRIESRKFLCVERDRLLVYSNSTVNTMCFGGPLIRTGCVISGSICLLSMLTDELCVIDLSEFIIKKYIKTDGIITERIIDTGTERYIYNTRGDIGVIGLEGIKRIRQGYLISRIKIFSEFGTTPVYALKQAGNGNIIAKINRRKGRVLKDRVEGVSIPVEMQSDGPTVFMKYQNRSEIIRNGKNPIRVDADVLAFNIYKKEVHFITRSGIISKHANKTVEERCIECSYYRERPDSETKISIEHLHGDSDKVFLADIHGSIIVYSTAEGVYIWNCKSSEKSYLGQYGLVISLSISQTKVVIGQESVTTIIDLKTSVGHNLAVAGRRVFPIDETDYILHRYDGSLWYVSGHRKYNICVGSILIKNIKCVDALVVINTENSTILIFTDEMGVLCAEYIENIGGAGVGCLTASNEFLMYEKNGISLYTLLDINEYTSNEVVYNEDILDYMPIDEYMIIVASTNRKIDPSTVSLDTETGIKVKIYQNTQEIDQMVYDGLYSVRIVHENKRIILGANSTEGFVLVILEIKNKKLVEVVRKTVEGISIISIDRKKNRLYCSTTGGLMTFIVKKKALELLPADKLLYNAKYSIESSYLVEYILTQVKLYEIDSKLPIDRTQTVYIDRIKHMNRALSVFDKEYFLLGYSQDSCGSIYVLKKEGQNIDKVFSVLLYSGIKNIKRASLSLIKRAEDLLILTETGSIYRMSLIADDILALLSENTPNSEISRNSPTLFTSEPCLAPESFTSQDVSVCCTQNMVSRMARLL